MTQASEHTELTTLIAKLREAAGDRLVAVVLYGSAARGEFQERTSDLNVLVVTRDLDPPTLELLGRPLGWWGRRGQPFPRLLTPPLITESADTFPLEFLDIQRFHRVLFGSDPFAALAVNPVHLRLQCERELREKLMRLREGYVECFGRSRDLERLLFASYTTFLALFRGCLFLLGGSVPARNDESVAAFCARAGVDPAPLQEIDGAHRARAALADPRALFLRYHATLTQAVAHVDRFDPQGGPR